MRTGMIGLTILAFTLITTAPVGAETYGRTGFQLDWWHDASGNRGLQYHIPIEAGGNIDHFSYKLLTAYAYNEIDPDHTPTHSQSGLVDTRLNLAYESIDRWPIDLLFALDMNLPTGQTGLPAGDVIYISDPDKVTITRMGEGLNINPSISVLKQWDGLLASIGIGYLWRGEYDAADTLRNYDPGNALNLTAEFDYNFSDQWLGRLFGSLTQFDTDRQAGADYYEPGDVRIFGGGVTYTREQWELAGVITGILRDKEQRQNTSHILLPAPNNYFGDEWIAELKGRMQISDRMDVKGWLKYSTIDANGYPSDNELYLSKRVKTTLGLELARRFSAHWEAGFRLQGYTMRVDDNPGNPGAGLDWDGGTVSLWVATRF